MSNIEKLKKELQDAFPKAGVKIIADGVSIFLGTVYNSDKRKIQELEKNMVV